jgi:hypothetical protein
MALDKAKNLQTETKGLYIKQKTSAQAVILTRQNRQGALETSPIGIHLISIGK